MRRHSLARKLFILTSLIIIGLLTVVFVFESIFFERFYRAVKQHEQESAIHQLMKEIEADQSDEQSIAYTIGSAMNEYDASIALLDDEYQLKRLDVYVIHMKSGDQNISVNISEEGIQYDELPKELSPGDILVVDGIFMDQNDTVMHPIDFYPESSEPESGLVRVQGKITNLLLPEQRSFNPMYQDLLIKDMLNDWHISEHTHIKQANYKTTEWRDPWSGVQYIATIGKLNDASAYIVMMSSLQPIDEAIAMLRKYVWMLFPFAVVIVIILALMYSRYIAKPLENINAFAKKLAQLQFSETPPVQSLDEYGQLSQHLVTLSRNLEKALQEVTAEGLQDGIAAHKRESYIAHIVQKTDEMNELVIELLELSKYEVNAITLTLAHFNIVKLVKDEVHALSIHLANKALQVDIMTTKLNQPYVIGDRKRIKQVIVNLLSNAARHAEAGSTISITIKNIAYKKVEITIYNDGPKIPEEHLQRIWDKFYRVEQARDRRSGGTGLGLTIAKHILKLHDSQFGTVNEQNGVAFYFTLIEGSAEDEEQK